MNEQGNRHEAPDPGTPPDLAPDDPPRDEAEREVDRAWAAHEAAQGPARADEADRVAKERADHLDLGPDDPEDPRPSPHWRDYYFGDLD